MSVFSKVFDKLEDWAKDVINDVVNFGKRLALKALKELTAYAFAQFIQRVPLMKLKAYAQDFGIWFTENVTPYIGQEGEDKMQEVKNEINKSLDYGLDHDDK